jgi:hypothetical protein
MMLHKMTDVSLSSREAIGYSIITCLNILLCAGRPHQSQVLVSIQQVLRAAAAAAAAVACISHPLWRWAAPESSARLHSASILVLLLLLLLSHASHILCAGGPQN